MMNGHANHLPDCIECGSSWKVPVDSNYCRSCLEFWMYSPLGGPDCEEPEDELNYEGALHYYADLFFEDPDDIDGRTFIHNLNLGELPEFLAVVRVRHRQREFAGYPRVVEASR